jgi:hypothetical protein
LEISRRTRQFLGIKTCTIWIQIDNGVVVFVALAALVAFFALTALVALIVFDALIVPVVAAAVAEDDVEDDVEDVEMALSPCFLTKSIAV